jgi:hypothetical protein
MKTSLTILIFLFVYSFSYPQPEKRGSEYCQHKKSSLVLFKIGENDAELEKSFDVLNYTLDLDIYNCFLPPYTKFFYGNETITIRADSIVSSIALNAVNSSIGIDSVGLAAVSFTHISNIVIINLDRVYNVGEIFDIKVYYHHNNITDNAFYTGNGIVFTDCEPSSLDQTAGWQIQLKQVIQFTTTG